MRKRILYQVAMAIMFLGQVGAMNPVPEQRGWTGPQYRATAAKYRNVPYPPKTMVVHLTGIAADKPLPDPLQALLGYDPVKRVEGLGQVPYQAPQPSAASLVSYPKPAQGRRSLIEVPVEIVPKSLSTESEPEQEPFTSLSFPELLGQLQIYIQEYAQSFSSWLKCCQFPESDDEDHGSEEGDLGYNHDDTPTDLPMWPEPLPPELIESLISRERAAALGNGH